MLEKVGTKMKHVIQKEMEVFVLKKKKTVKNAYSSRMMLFI